jgi:hypothetical protein
MAWVGGARAAEPTPDAPEWTAAAVKALEDELVATYGEAQRERAGRGLEQVASFWRAADGDRATFEGFARRHFAGDADTLATMFERFERLLEQLDGHMLEIMLAFRWQSDLDLGPILPFDEVFAGYNPSAHVIDDFFDNKLAFVVLLNFPLTTLEQRLSEGRHWTRRQWAEARLADRFSKRVPAEVQLEVARAGARAGRYIARYNIWMHHLLVDGQRVFPPKLRLLTHWNLRDEVKASYTDPKTGLQRQRTIQKVMERIVDQTIPEVVIDSPHVDWNPFTNEVTAAGVRDSDAPVPEGLEISNAREPDTRYALILNNFRAQRKVDPWSPTAPTLIARRFNEDREIPEERVRAMFETVLSSPLLEKVARLVESRLGRALEPFDIWYSGFRPRGAYTEAELDVLVKERYPTAQAYEKDMPKLLEGLGFTKDRASELAEAIAVDPARGSGHAWGAAMREAKSRLRTRVGSDGMDYKAFNIAVHEMGHNVEQTISLREVDHTLLNGVPNTAFTEALAFVFQARDLELLGLATPSAESRALQALDDFWGGAEIAAVALVDMGVWHWMYEHPEATPAELREATMAIARGVWNRYYAPVIGPRDCVLLGIYSHMVARNLYLPDYPIGSLIAVQLEEQMAKTGDLGAEFTRMAVFGNVVPDLWMKNATGSPVGPDALLAAAARALEQVGESSTARPLLSCRSSAR